MEVQHVNCAVQAVVKQADDGRTEIKAMGEVWGTPNRAGRVFVPGAFKQSIRGINAENPLPMGLEHVGAVGVWQRVRETPEGLELSKGLVSQTTQGQDATILLQDKALKAVSIGFIPLEFSYAAPGEKMSFQTPLGEVTYRFQDAVVYHTKVDLVETSLVMAPAQPKALIMASLEKAQRALPVLQHSQEPSWEDAAYSMALLMGGRGAAAFADLPDEDHFDLYRQVAAAYTKLARTAPPYVREPVYAEIEFQHDERAVFSDRYLRKTLATAVAGARGLPGPLSEETRQLAQEAVAVLGPLTEAPPSELAAVVDDIREIAKSLRGE